MSSLHHQPKATDGGLGGHFTGRRRTGKPEVVLLPRPGLFLRIRRSHVELHVLYLPMTQVARKVVDLSTGDLPMSDEDTPQYWVINEGVLSTRPPLSGTLRTSHPRPLAIPSPFQP